jgi:hypothetical protein
MTTQLVYLEDFDVTTCSAAIVSLEETEDDRTDHTARQNVLLPAWGRSGLGRRNDHE